MLPAEEMKDSVKDQIDQPKNERAESSNVEVAELYSCDRCKYETEKAAELKEHTMEVHGVQIQNFNCDKCEFVATFNALLRRHTSIKHTEVIDDVQLDSLENEEPCAICGQCGKTFAEESQCIEHVNAHLHRCFKCSFESKVRNEVRKHEVLGENMTIFGR